jgi:hypothetical protein
MGLTPRCVVVEEPSGHPSVALVRLSSRRIPAPFQGWEVGEWVYKLNYEHEKHSDSDPLGLNTRP